ncbi:LamG-like jellyroll fold domain-containing protein [Sulfuriroseicoccus oceanibius]|uniref:LamG-like jellyroll fold domain-containing protein n=1 Tax=Sulfuriroseicoccus oceanibius TaxID=2707525 RepID=UPI001F42D8E3|nr:LamG-like jellyroll fold domain-containing protein [Sulfuriroseicoccus oceanibius]
MKKLVTKPALLAAVASLAAVGSADAAISQWLNQAQNTAGNVTADNTGWTFDGTAGVQYDFGTLDQEGIVVDGSTVEFIFNFTDNATSMAIASVMGWAPGNEMNVLKLEQWSDKGVMGITVPGYWDYDLATASPFDQDVHVVFRRNDDGGNGGSMDIFVNGVYAETDVNKTNWRMDGSVGWLGSNHQGNNDFAEGQMYGVASYDVALTDQEISDLYSAFSTDTVPEPSSTALLGLGGLAIILRRRK